MKGASLTSISRVRRPRVQDKAESTDRAVSLSHSAAVDDLILMLCREYFGGHGPRPVASRGSRARADATAHCASMLGRHGLLSIVAVRYKVSFVAVQVGS